MAGQSAEASERHHLLVGEGRAGERLDAVLAGAFADFSRSRLKALILEGRVSIGGRTIGEPNHRVKSGDEVILDAPPPADPLPAPEAIALDVLYEDDALIVLNKPPGLVVHPAPGSPSGTLVNALIHHCGPSLAGIGGVRRPGIVHRLDKDTSGVMVAAKTETALAALARQFADHGRTGPLRRVYVAFVWGRVQRPAGTVDAPLGRDSRNRLKQAVRHDGRAAVTRWRVEARHAGEGWEITRLRCELMTGRTHQIRVHLAHIGHPILGDPLYAPGFATKARRLPEDLRGLVDGLGRQALHAAELGFEHPVSGVPMAFVAPPPPDLQALADALHPYDGAASAAP